MNNRVFSFFGEKKEILLKRWKEDFFEAFKEAKPFFLREVDAFQNPFAYRIEEIFQEILNSIDPDFSWERLNPYLERLGQILAVYFSSAREGMGVFLSLKGILREFFGEEILERFGVEGLLKIEDLINSLMLVTFDFYLKYREKLFEIKYQEWKRNNYLLLKRAGLVYDPMEGMPPMGKET